MTYREQLELAAKAAGIPVFAYVEHVTDWDSPHYGRPAIQTEEGTHNTWNSFEDDGDAFRLLVDMKFRLNREVNCGDDIFEVFGPERDDMTCDCSTESVDDVPHLSARRAVTLAAAKIGKEMK